MTRQRVAVTLSTADSSNKFGLGAIHEDKYGTVYQYLLANGAVTASNAVIIPDDKDTAKATTTNAGAVPQGIGVAMATAADNEYYWAAIGPIAASSGVTVSALASCAADVKLYTTATAGSVDDTATTQIFGLSLTTANGGSTANVACVSPCRLTVNS